MVYENRTFVEKNCFVFERRRRSSEERHHDNEFKQLQIAGGNKSGQFFCIKQNKSYKKQKENEMKHSNGQTYTLIDIHRSN